MFAASKIYIFVNFSEDDGDYFVIFKSAVGNDKQRKRMKRLKTILVWQNVICVMLLDSKKVKSNSFLVDQRRRFTE